MNGCCWLIKSRIELTLELCVSGAEGYEPYVERPKAELDKASKQQITAIMVIDDDVSLDKVTFIVNLHV